MSYQSTDLTVNHSRETAAYGRGGKITQTGTAVSVSYDGDIRLQPVTSRGKPTDYAMLTIPMDAVPSFLEAVERLYEEEMTRMAVFSALMRWRGQLADPTAPYLLLREQDANTLARRRPTTHYEVALQMGEAWATKYGKEVLSIIKQAKHKQTF